MVKYLYVSFRFEIDPGLSIILNLEQHEYFSLFGQRAGARITITRPNVRALPTEDGFMIRPGVETSIGLRLVGLGLYVFFFIDKKS